MTIIGLMYKPKFNTESSLFGRMEEARIVAIITAKTALPVAINKLVPVANQKRSTLPHGWLNAPYVSFKKGTLNKTSNTEITSF